MFISIEGRIQWWAKGTAREKTVAGRKPWRGDQNESENEVQSAVEWREQSGGNGADGIKWGAHRSNGRTAGVQTLTQAVPKAKSKMVATTILS